MFCTKCGNQLRDQDRFCPGCGATTAPGFVPRHPEARPEARLTRPMNEAKIAGVCAGFARYFALDVTLVRVLWAVITVFPLPCFGLVSYIVAWIVMPKDPVSMPISAAVSPLPPTNQGA